MTPQQFDTAFIDAGLKLQAAGAPPSLYAMFAVFSALGVITLDEKRAAEVFAMSTDDFKQNETVRQVIVNLSLPSK